MRDNWDKDWGLTLEGHLLMWGWAECGGGHSASNEGP